MRFVARLQASGGSQHSQHSVHDAPLQCGGTGAWKVGVWKNLRTEDKGATTAFAAHPHAPLLATASNSQSSQVPAHRL